MSIRRGFGIEEFERALDEIFDELLIDPWKSFRPGAEAERAQIIDRADRYEVRITARVADPSQIQVDASGQRLTVRIPSLSGEALENIFSFATAIDAKAAVTQWSNGVLTIMLPKKKIRQNNQRKP
ncbi:MAG TPA: Hsp20/alpha crystallin family protein [Candidatus Binataceae bacterium]|nr:Hsp20/alpha crystallin family protein [Candidatus Binataceae bacterium]